MIQDKSSKGFTILEVMLGVALFALGLMGVMALLVSTINGNAFSARLSEASLLAANKLEELMSVTYGTGNLVDSNLDALAGLHDIGVNADFSQEGIGKNNSFNVYWNNAPDEPEVGSTTIGVTVTWSEKGVQRILKVAGVRIDEID